MLIRTLVCGYTAAARLVELALSRRNLRSSGPSEEGEWSRRTFPLVVLVHTAVIAGTFFFGEKRPRLLPLALFLAVQPLRFWVLLTLGTRWNARGAVARVLQVETGGPYALVRHPNYCVVVVELATLPLAFGRRHLAIATGLANAALLALRIRDEERLLMRQPAYRRHFATKPRFLPFLF